MLSRKAACAACLCGAQTSPNVALYSYAEACHKGSACEAPPSCHQSFSDFALDRSTRSRISFRISLLTLPSTSLRIPKGTYNYRHSEIIAACSPACGRTCQGEHVNRSNMLASRCTFSAPRGVEKEKDERACLLIRMQQ